MFKREDYKQTKHDAVFSKWQVLIGSNDWEDFRKGKDGAARYRVQNLPHQSCPGLYELGVAIMSHARGRKFDPDDVLVAYLGQAESVRSRLQSYGRSGAHLSTVNRTYDNHDHEPNENLDKKPVTAALFEDIFSKDGSILYRWAPMRSKRDAEVTEMLLLGTFDYAWNKGSNGNRRHYDLFNKLGDDEFMSRRISSLSNIRFLPFVRKHVGVRIKGEKHVLMEERKLSGDVEEEKKTGFLSGILQFNRFRPRPVSDRHETSFGSESGSACGVILNDGSSCTRVPVKGRKRCTEHKGLRIHPVSSRPIPEKEQIRKISDEEDDQDSDEACGVILFDGKTCRNRPVSGRKRCEEHKGMRINAFLFLQNQEERQRAVTDKKCDSGTCPEETSLFCGAITKSGSPCTRSPSKGNRRCWQHKEKTLSHLPPENVPPVCFSEVICGVKLYDGSVCQRSPVKGRKRCEQHKGMRI